MMPSGLVTVYKLTDLSENFLFVKSLKEGKETFEKPKLLFSEIKHHTTFGWERKISTHIA